MTMKTSFLKILPFMVVAAGLLFLAGCGITQSDYDEVVAERDTAQGENETLQGEIERLEGQPVVSLPDIAERIRNGTIDVGTGEGLAFSERFHKIHYTVIGLGCTSCHTSGMTTQQEVFQAQDVSLAAPAPVDRSGCLACHGTGGPATTFYGSE